MMTPEVLKRLAAAPVALSQKLALGSGEAINIRIRSNGASAFAQYVGKLIKDTLDLITTSRFKEYISIRSLDVIIVPNEDALAEKAASYGSEGYSGPEFNKEAWYFGGAYLAHMDVLLLNEASMGKDIKGAQAICLHEMLHAFSTSKREFEGKPDEKLRSGITQLRIREETGSYYADHPGENHLNEGITEYLRREISGSRLTNRYEFIRDQIPLLIQMVGEDLLLRAYFSGREELPIAFDHLHGPGAYKELLHYIWSTLDPLPRPYYFTLVRDHIRFGFEAEIMDLWGYTADDRSREPREISPGIFPERVASVFRERRVKIFTNLTPEELERFLIYLPREERHIPEYNGMNQSFTMYSRIEDFILKVGLDRQLVIKVKKNENNVQVLVSNYERESFNQPNPLGRKPSSEGVLFWIRL